MGKEKVRSDISSTFVDEWEAIVIDRSPASSSMGFNTAPIAPAHLKNFRPRRRLALGARLYIMSRSYSASFPRIHRSVLRAG